MDDRPDLATPVSSPTAPTGPNEPPASSGPRPGGFYHGPRGGPRGGPRRPGRSPFGRDARPRRACRFCVEHKETVDYKDIALLRSFITERGKMLAGRATGTCARHQRKVRTAIKRARIIALLPSAGF